LARKRLPYYYTRKEEEIFLKIIPNQVIRDLFIILFGTGLRISELLGEPRRKCITCLHFKPKKKRPNSKEPGIPWCFLVDQALPKSPKLYVCNKHEARHPPLRIEQLNIERRELRVIGKGDKERLVIVAPTAIEAFKRVIGKRTSGEIDFGIGIRRAEELTRHYAKKAGLLEPDKNGRWSPHKMRHTHATQLVEAAREGGQMEAVLEAKEQLGHESIDTTMQYLHVSSDSDPRRKSTEKM
jgi:integrase